MLSMWHTKTMSPDWSILSLKELETRVQHHNFRKSTWKTTPFFSAGYIYYCDSPRTWKCSCQLVMLLWAAAKDAAAEQKVDYKIIFGGLQTHSHFQVKSLQKQRALNLQPSVWVWTHKAVKISALSFNFFIHHVPVHCPSLAKGPLT